jgi:hypothetical protein
VPLPHSPRRLHWLYIHAMHGQGSHAAARSRATDSQPRRTAAGTLSERLARSAASTRFEDLPPRAVADAKRVLLDTLGAARSAAGSAGVAQLLHGAGRQS